MSVIRTKEDIANLLKSFRDKFDETFRRNEQAPPERGLLSPEKYAEEDALRRLAMGGHNAREWQQQPALNEHQVRMKWMAAENPEISETLTALCSLCWFGVDSSQISHFGLKSVGQSIAWRVFSTKWQLEVIWLDGAVPAIETFQARFGELSDAINAKREELVAQGKPLPTEFTPPIHNVQLQQLAGFLQAQQSAGLASVVDQQAFQNQLANYGGLPAHYQSQAGQAGMGSINATYDPHGGSRA